MILLDTDHISVLLDERDARNQALTDRLRRANDLLTVPIVSIEEQLRAWLAKIHRVNDPARQVLPYLRLKRVFVFFREWPILDFDEASAEHFANLRALRLKICAQDLKIACTALARDALLLSANLRDFERVPGLRVEDWLN